MEDIRFERHFRTPHSEGYYIMQGSSVQSNNRLGTVDIHFTTTAVPRDDFLVSVYVGKDVGFYSDEYFAEESDSSTGFDDDEEE